MKSYDNGQSPPGSEEMETGRYLGQSLFILIGTQNCRWKCEQVCFGGMIQCFLSQYVK